MKCDPFLAPLFELGILSKEGCLLVTQGKMDSSLCLFCRHLVFCGIDTNQLTSPIEVSGTQGVFYKQNLCKSNVMNV